MFEGLKTFLADTTVAPLFLLVILAMLNFVLKVYASTKPGWPGDFDWGKLPQLLDTLVLRKVIPLAFLGAASYIAPSVTLVGIDVDTKQALTLLYLGGVSIAILAELMTVREAFPQTKPPEG